MLALDTNVLARLIVRDDEAQFTRATALMSEPRVFVGTTVLLETAWLLRKVYRLPKAEVVTALRRLIGLPNVELDHRARVERALGWATQGMDVADAFHLAGAEEADALASFDRPLARQASALGASPPVREP